MQSKLVAVLPRAARSSRTSAITRCRTFRTSSRSAASYGFIGLGQMGYPMAKNIRLKIGKDDRLFVNDVNTAATARFKEELREYDVAIEQDVKAIAEKADTIITVLPMPQHVEKVFNLMLESQKSSTSSPGLERLFIDCSTIDIKTSAKVAEATQSSGQGRFIDAPMSGGVVGASAGKLTFMIGAAPELVERATAVLSFMGKRVVHLGPQTSGLKGKLANNYLLALNNIATAEAMNMGVKWGLDPKTLADMINTATGKCWPSEVNNPVPGVVEGAPAGRDYQGGFGTALMLKDLNLALQAAAEADIVPRLGPHAKDIYTAVEGDAELKGKDFSVVYKYVGGKGV